MGLSAPLAGRMMTQIALLTFNGLASGMAVFLVAAGLTLVFGILHILNFSHGGVFMIAAYVALTVQALFAAPISGAAFAISVVAAGFAAAILGLAIDRLVFRRLSGVPEAYTLIATYALLLICQGVVKLIWGLDFKGAPPPEALLGALVVSGVFLPSYSIFLIAAGIVVFIALDVVIYRTSLGKRIRAVAIDPWMSSLVGLNVQAVFTVTVVAGFALAGLAGGLLLANQSLSPELGSAFIIQAFGAIIVGGMGSIRGTFVACLLLGLINAFGIVLIPDIPGVLFYVALAAMILVRPQGLFWSART